MEGNPFFQRGHRKNLRKHSLAPAIQFKDFDIAVVSLNLIEVGVSCIFEEAGLRWKDPLIDSENPASQRRRRLAETTAKVEIGYELWCRSDNSAIFSRVSTDDSFRALAEGTMSSYLGEGTEGEGVAFEDPGSFNSIDDEAIPLLDQILNDGMLMINLIYLAIASLICFLAYLHVRIGLPGLKKVDIGHTQRFFIFALQASQSLFFFFDLLICFLVHRFGTYHRTYFS